MEVLQEVAGRPLPGSGPLAGPYPQATGPGGETSALGVAGPHLCPVTRASATIGRACIIFSSDSLGFESYGSHRQQVLKSERLERGGASGGACGLGGSYAGKAQAAQRGCFQAQYYYQRGLAIPHSFISWTLWSLFRVQKEGRLSNCSMLVYFASHKGVSQVTFIKTNSKEL